MRANRKRVKEWLRQMDKEDYQRLLDTALFTPDEKEYIHHALYRRNDISADIYRQRNVKEQHVPHCRADSKQD